ncbi:MAG: iron chelate uptake ABC transporter family permease subunit [Bacteroidota bacterium]
MKETFIEFFTFSYPNITYVVVGTVLLSISSALVGCFTFLRKKSLVGDVVSHAVLPGICLSFLLTGYKNPLIIVAGAFFTGWLSIAALDYVVRHSKIKEDTATGLSLSVFFGLGILLLTFIQHSGNAQQTGLDAFLFGKAAALVGQDLIVFGILAVITLLMVLAFFKEFQIIAFDQQFATSMGLPVKSIEMILTSVTVLAVVAGIQAVGVVLMAAMLITPAATAKFWTDRLQVMLLLAAIFGAFSGITGAFISYAAPAMPTGPWMVMVLSFLALISFFFAPQKGILVRLLRQRRIRRKQLEENLLKAFYAVGERLGTFDKPLTLDQIGEKRSFRPEELRIGLRRLVSHGYLRRQQSDWQLTADGLSKGRRVQRLHRLWELYLTEYLSIAPDHVHEDAESIEHVITPELELELERLLDHPIHDPHQSVIPSRD